MHYFTQVLPPELLVQIFWVITPITLAPFLCLVSSI